MILLAKAGSSPRTTVITSITALFDSDQREIVTDMLAEECSAKRLRTTSADLVERVQLVVLKLSVRVTRTSS